VDRSQISPQIVALMSTLLEASHSFARWLVWVSMKHTAAIGLPSGLKMPALEAF